MPRFFSTRQPWKLCLVVGCLLATVSGCGGCGSPGVNRFTQGYTRDDEEEDVPTAAVATANARKAPAPTPAPAAPGTTPKTPPAGGPAQTGAIPVTPNQAVPAGVNVPGEMPLSGAENVNILPLDPSKTLNSSGRRHHTLARMKKISLAIGDYVAEHSRFPPPASYNKDKYPLLSWRVHMLPFVGQEGLYHEFHLNEPWNSAHNETLIAKIPQVYQSPERRDTKTNYMLVTGPGTVFSNIEGVKPQDVTDGLANTVMLVEVNDDHSVPWTQPIDLSYTPDSETRRGLGALREDGFFLAWASGKLARIPPDVDDLALRPMFTRDGKERFNAASVSKEAVPEIDPKFADRLKPPAAVAVNDASQGGTTQGSVKPTPPTTPGVSTPSEGPAVKQRLPVPDEDAQQKSQVLFREIYRDEYEKAKSAQQKYDLAKKLLDQAAKMRDDPAGRYVLLSAAGKIAAEAGDVTTAMSIAEKILESFDVRTLEVKGDLLIKAAKAAPRTKADDDKAIDEGNKLLTDALLDDNFALALELYGVALAAARRVKNKEKVEDLADRRREIEVARVSYSKVEKVVDALASDPDNPDHNLTVGKYLCFIKRNWERGLPLLGQGSDDTLKRLARKELAYPTGADEQTALADEWWERAERERDKQGLKREMQLRAVYWYLIATPRLPEGLLKLKVEVRIKEAEKTYGKDAVEPLRQAQRIK